MVRDHPHIFISAGEPSGDLHAASLARELKARWPNIRISGFGGPKFRETGSEVIYPLTDLAVMWIGEVLINLDKFMGILQTAANWFDSERPDAVVLIDYPGLHWEMAKRAKDQDIPVFYFVPPQIWAWAGWRVEKVRRWIDHVLCSLPFEPDWYHRQGVPQAVYIGHPYFDEIAHRPLNADFLNQIQQTPGPKLAVLPGSRSKEVQKNFPSFLKAAEKLKQHQPEIRLLVSCLHERHQAMVAKMIKDSQTSVEFELYAGRTPEILRVADCAWAVSGSVSLELMAEELPTAILYQVTRLDLLIARPFIKSRYITLVNLLANEEIYPEFLTHQDVTDNLVKLALNWINDPQARLATVKKLQHLKSQVAQPGAAGRAADCLGNVLQLSSLKESSESL